MAIRSVDFIVVILTSVVVSNVRSESDEKVSLTFVIDKTNSMGTEINATVAGAEAIFDAVASSDESPIDNYVLVTFGDPDVSSPIITKDTDEFKRALVSIDLESGMDCPEASMSGIKKALEASLPGSYLYVFTDASSNDFHIYDEVENLAQEKRCQVVFVLTDHCPPHLGNDNVYHELAEATSGQVFDLKKQNMKKILKYVEESIASRRVNILSGKYPPGTHSVPYVSDPRTRNTVVAITGSYITAKVTGPDGETLPDYLVNLNKVLIFKVEDMPGDYLLNFTSNTTAYVVVSATSDVRFHHGFSTALPSCFNDTVYKPFSDVKNYLTIKIFGDNVTLKTVQFFDSNYQNLSLEIQLTKLDKEQKLYRTDFVDPPKSPFRIAVKGDVDDTTIRRFGSMLLKSDTYDDKIPTITIEGGLKVKLDYDKPLTLTCIVNALPKPNIIIWKDMDGIPLPTAVIQESPYIYIVSLELQHLKKNAGYECFASNKMGNGSNIVQVEVLHEHFLKFLETPKSIEVDLNTEAVLHCKADGYPPAKIKWRTRRKQKPFFQISPDNSTLTIKRMHPLAEGYYGCIAENFEETKFSRAIITISASSASKPRIDKATFEVHETENSSPSLSCKLLEGKPWPSITWYRQYSSSNMRFEIENGRNRTNISLYKVNKYETGTYTCEVKNVMGNDAHSIYFFVDYPPIIKNDVKSIKAKKGEQIYIQLPVEGSPMPDVVWHKDGKPIGNDIRLYRDNSFKVEADFSRGGNYTCIATNELGSDKQTVEVIIYTLDIKPPLKPIVVEEKEKLTIVCEAKGVPELNFSWIFTSSDKSRSAEILPFTGSSLTINKVDRTQSGNYICKASNIGDSQDILYRVDVLYEPYIQADQNEYKAVEGAHLMEIHCSATGNPKPDIVWNKNGAPLYKGPRYSIYGGWLNITDVQKSDGGYYSCAADNSIGVIPTSSFEVTVGSEPTFVITQKNYMSIELEIGQSNFLNCQATAKPNPTVIWRHNNVIINFSEMVFYFEMDTQTIGDYSCTVTNAFGSISRSFHLSLKGCVLKINKDSKTQPLILTTAGNWPTFKIVNGLMFVPKGQELRFSCPKSDVNAQCDEGTKLKVNGGPYDYTDIKCKETIKASVNHTKIACLGKKSKLFRYILDVKDKSIQLYEVCVDQRNFPIYTKHIMRNPAGNFPKDSLSNNPKLDKALYTCAEQKKFFPPQVKKIISMVKHCCFAKRPLVNPKDLFPGPAQWASLSQVNTVPHWSSCNSENWNEVEDRVRKLSKSINEDLIVYTGTAHHWKFPVQSRGKTEIKPLYLGRVKQHQAIQPIYEYLWKVIQYPAGGSSLAIIQLNIPGVKPSEVKVHCRDVCEDSPWMKGPNWKIMEKGHIVCCDLRDFVTGFNYSNIFESGLDKRLDLTI